MNKFLIEYLLNEKPRYSGIAIPESEQEQFRLYRSLVNIRLASPVSQDYINAENQFLQDLTKQKGITDIAGLQPIENTIYLWQGDITTLKCSAIVNAANSGMTGCYQPCHNCIDNAIPFSITQSCMQSRMAHG